MASVLVWILIFAGATLGLLATFLIASETELKAHQDESNDSSDNPMPTPTFISESASSGDPLQAPAELDEMTQKNRELLGEVTLLMDQRHSANRQPNDSKSGVSSPK